MTESTEEMLARVRASFDRQAMMTTLGVEVTAVERGVRGHQHLPPDRGRARIGRCQIK